MATFIESSSFAIHTAHRNGNFRFQKRRLAFIRIYKLYKFRNQSVGESTDDRGVLVTTKTFLLMSDIRIPNII
jgi:hypothetical protein